MMSSIKFNECEDSTNAVKICDVKQRQVDETTVVGKESLSASLTPISIESSNTGRSENDAVAEPKQKQQIEEVSVPPETEMQSHQKQGRKRKKHVFNAIRTQMEFYFGNANLSKDRFLKQLIDKDPYVPLEVFLNFNKLKQLTQNVEDIAKSLSNSQLLEVDESRQKVRRKTPIDLEQNVDSKTLYVEALPANADHDWVRHVFERFGPVTYVSLPRYPTSRKIKEFGFVEFEREVSVEKAIKAFQQFDAVLSLQTSDPAGLQSVQAYMREEEQGIVEVQEKKCITIKKEKKEINLVGEQRELGEQQQDKELDENTSLPNKRTKKRRRPIVESLDEKLIEEDEDIKNKKRLKILKNDDDEIINTKDTEQTLKSKKDCQDDDNDGGAEISKMNSADAADDNDSVDTDNKNKENDKDATDADADVEGKIRLKKRKKKFNQLELDPSCFDLRILPKCDWKRLRNKYLNLQRQKVRELKQQWRKQQQHHEHQQYSSYHSQQFSQQQEQQQQLLQSINESNLNSKKHESLSLNDKDTTVTLPAKRLKSDMHKMSMNFYGAGSGENDDSLAATTAGSLATPKGSVGVSNIKEENTAQQKVPLFVREPGLIVEINLLEPCANVKEFKADMRQYASVKYVDIKEGAMQANLRLESASAAEDLVQQLNCSEYKCKILRGKAESRYWKKIESDREMKLNKKIHVPQKRGREKVNKILFNSHIHFDDDDNNDNDEVHVSQTEGADAGATGGLPFNNSQEND